MIGKDTTRARVRQVIRAVFAFAESEICQCCIITDAHRKCRNEGLPVSRRDVTARVKALWNEDVSAGGASHATAQVN